METAAVSSDGMVEIWQANAHGKYAHPDDRQKKPLQKGFKGFGRVPTDAKGGFRFTTIKPGRVPRPTAAAGAAPRRGGVHARHAQAPRHAHLLSRRARPTRGSDPQARAAARRATLIAEAQGQGAGVEHRAAGQERNGFFDY
jgi:protocatechuate 3,4-dioxygenase alpha subunit